MAETQVARSLDPSTGMTCIACSVVFANFDIQREHYKTEWHRYNLKRKVTGLPPISDHQFHEKVLNFRNKAEEKIAEDQNAASMCKACNKVFKSRNAFDNHLNSKRHKENVEKFAEENDGDVSIKMELPPKQPNANLPNVAAVGSRLMSKAEELAREDEDDDDDSSSGWVTDHGSDNEEDMDMYDETQAIPVDTCLFCPATSGSMEKNLVHMSHAHGFFIPDAEYCSDVEGLLKYLGMKVGSGRMCLWCGEKSKIYNTMKDAQRHMQDKQHTRMCHEGELILEYIDYYDFSPLIGETGEDELMEEPEELYEDDWSLTLPSGARIGHRSLFRYYRQHVRDTPSDGAQRRRGREALQGALGKYKALGWTGTSGAIAVQRAKDIKFVQKVIAKQRMKMGMKKLFKTRGRKDQMPCTMGRDSRGLAEECNGERNGTAENGERNGGGANGYVSDFEGFTNEEEYLKEMKRRRKQTISLDEAAELLYEDVLMGFVTQIAFTQHRAHKLGLVLEPEVAPMDPTQPSTSNGKAGSSNGTKNKYEAPCPECGRNIAATRFAPHLENCLGMGRNASRAARRKTAAGFYAAGNNFGSKSDTNLVSKNLTNGEVTHSATNSIIDGEGGSDNELDVSIEDDDDDWKGKKARKRKPAAKRGGRAGKRKR